MFSILARLALDSTGYRLGLKQAESATTAASKRFNANLKGQIAGAFGAAAITAGFAAAIQHASEITDRASKLGVNPETLQKREFAMKQAGADADDYQKAIIGIGKARQKALESPDGNEAKAFERLGVSLDDLKSKNADDVFVKIGEAIKASGNSQEVLSDGLTTMGRSAAAVFPAMRDGLVEVGNNAVELGLVLSEDTTDALDEIGDKFAILKNKGINTFAVLANGALNFAKKFADGFEVVTTGLMVAFDELLDAEGKNLSGKELWAKITAGYEKGSTQAAQDILDAEEKLAEARAKKREKRDRPEFNFAARPEMQKEQFKSESLAGHVTDLQKIGAQVAASNETITILREQLRVQNEIARAANATANAIKSTGDFE